MSGRRIDGRGHGQRPIEGDPMLGGAWGGFQILTAEVSEQDVSKALLAAFGFPIMNSLPSVCSIKLSD